MRRDERLAPLIALLAGTAITFLFLTRFRPALQVMVEVLRPSGAALLVLLAVVASGALGARVASCLFGTVFIRLPLSDAVILGFPLFGIVIAACSLVSTRLILPLTVVGGAVGALLVLRHVRSPDPELGSASTGGEPFRPAARLLLIVPALLGLLEAITPASSPDELIYKLAVPHQYLLAGRMFEMPWSSNSYLVMALQCTDMAALAIGGAIAAKMISYLLFLASLAVIHRLAKALVPDAAPWLTAVVAWTPALLLIAGWAWSEWGVLGLIVLSMERWERWLDEHKLSDAAIAFAAAGGAVSSKFTALPWLLTFGLVMIWRCRDVRILVRGALLVALFGSFFYVRNLLWTGSPFAPLLLPHAPQVTNYRSGGAMSGWSDLLRGYDILDPSIIDESLGILLPFAAMAGLFVWTSSDRRARDLFAAGALQMPILLTIAPGSRNVINGVVPLALAGGVVIVAAWRVAGRTLRLALLAVCFTAFAAQLLLVGYAAGWEEWVPYLTGRETAAAYLGRTRGFMRPYQWLHANTSFAARILMLGENRPLYLDRRAISAGNLDSPRIVAWLSGFRSAEALRRELARLQVTHVLVGRERYQVGAAPMSMMEKEYVLQLPVEVHMVVMQLLGEAATLRYRDSRYEIFELRPWRKATSSKTSLSGPPSSPP